MNSNVSIRPASAADLPAAARWLADAGLPVEDLTADHLVLAADMDGVPSAVIGIERLGQLGLLRSLIVTPDGRGRGIGRLLVDALESNAVRDGIAELWLLTIDADPFFEALGYVRRQRDEAPPAIQSTAEFSSLCPGDAVVMSKSLG